MIILKSNNEFLNSSIFSLLEQKNLFLNNDNINFNFNIDLQINDDFLIMIINKKKFKFILPLNLNSFLGKIIEELFIYKVSLNDIDYYPYQRIIKNSSQEKSYLSEIQNLIFLNLFKNDIGYDKFDLYKLIWNKDKIISINKLDTHLTNLKNQIENDLKIKLIFQSYQKILRLIID